MSGFGTKLFLLTAAVAVVAAGATAFFTVRQARIQVDESAAVAEQDADTIVRTLAAAGALRVDWHDLDELVASLAKQTGQRIRVTEGQGGLVVDSDTVGGGQARPVSNRAALTVDPVPVPDFTGVPAGQWLEQTSLALSTYLSAYRAAGCLRADGLAYGVRPGPLGVPTRPSRRWPRSAWSRRAPGRAVRRSPTP
jgi:two-component system sensor histidine kinase BaeS